MHPLAGTIELPLLVPAFSSKGFDFLFTGKGKSKREYSALAYTLEQFATWQAVSSLVSAYDLHHRHFVAPGLTKNVASLFLNCHVVIVDSGGYELNTNFDSCEIKSFLYRPKPGFGEPEYHTVLNQINKDGNNLHLIVTNFDHGNRGGAPIPIQIRTAKELFSQYPRCLSDFIIKPWTKNRGSRRSNPDDPH